MSWEVYPASSLLWKYREDFARVASPKMMSDCHMLRMNVCDAGRHAGTQRHGKGLTFIRVRAWLARGRATRTRQTVCDPDRQAETQRHEKGLTFIRAEDKFGLLRSLLNTSEHKKYHNCNQDASSSAGVYDVLETGTGQTLILGRRDHLHRLGWP